MAGRRCWLYLAQRKTAAEPSTSPSDSSDRHGDLEHLGTHWSPPLSRAAILGLLFVLGTLLLCPRCFAQEDPYFVTYTHHLEEPGNLEVEYFSNFGTQRAGNDFIAPWVEFEYGATAWWTTEVYLDSQGTFNDSAVFTGFRWENRFRPLAQEHFLNPVIYVEYENITEGDKTMKEVEGHDVESDYAVPNADLNRTWNHELEIKLILSKDLKGWNVALNPYIAKNFSPNNPLELAYAVGVSRPLALKASPNRCSFCRENFIAGVEMYGGLGDTQILGLPDTSHYLAPVVAWNLPSGWTVRFSTAFGLNGDSHRLLVRWGMSREFPGFGEIVSHLLGGSR
jgi:hypothetical protein